MASHTIKIPRPGPGQYVIAACDEDGATSWIIASAAVLEDAPFMTCVPGLLDEAQQRLRDTQPRP